MRGEKVNGSNSYKIYLILSLFNFEVEEKKTMVDKSDDLTIRVLWVLISF